MTAALLVGIATYPALGATGRDLLQSMSKEQLMSYLAGSVDMLSYQAVLDGNRERGQCIADALYRDTNHRATEGVLDAAARYPDKDPVILIIAVMEQVCPK